MTGLLTSSKRRGLGFLLVDYVTGIKSLGSTVILFNTFF